MSPRVLHNFDDLARASLVSSNDAGALAPVLAKYSTAISADIAALIDPTDPHDPVARQFVPDVRELRADPAELRDPIGDDAHSPTPGLVHRYEDRVLLKIAAACPVYCRFCFRRETVGEGKGGLLSERDLSAALEYVAGHAEIREVILTGGDPLALSPRRLGKVLARIAAIAHVKTLRIHTRVPVVTPAHIDETLVAALRGAGKPVYVALHANHPCEFTATARNACAKLVDAGIPMLSQTVLLAGVNDDVETLVALMQAFVETRVTPYYLHHPDLAPGTKHFRMPIATGRALAAALRARLSGFARPRYVLDLPGGFGKISLEGDAATEVAPGSWQMRDRHGHLHEYIDSCAPSSDRGAVQKPD